jgi:hypothetical protein
MLIKVKYIDKRYDLVKPWFLDELILAGEIISFRRSNGWVNILRDKIRGMGGWYKGPERRGVQS